MIAPDQTDAIRQSATPRYDFKARAKPSVFVPLERPLAGESYAIGTTFCTRSGHCQEPVALIALINVQERGRSRQIQDEHQSKRFPSARRFRMRLLDLIAHTRDPVLITSDVHGGPPFALSGPKDFAQRIAMCPLRFVLADSLTRASAELAFSEGTRLVNCLDLVRIPASAVWVEWNDSVHQEVICASGAIAKEAVDSSQRQVGVLLEASPSGRSAIAHTFWTALDPSGAGIAEMAPIETYMHLDERFEPTADGGDLLRGESVSLSSHLPHIADLLERVRFKLEHSWSQYYRKVASEQKALKNIVRMNLGAVAYDIPLLLAFFLLLTAKGATRAVEIRRQQLNYKRVARDRRPLLDHIEVHASLPGSGASEAEDTEESQFTRQSPRLHHVRGHLVRREEKIFWRVPHLRGKALRGVIRSRTVCLSFAST